MGPQGDVAQNKLAAEDAITEMKKLGEGLLTDSIVEDFKGLAFHFGWCAANRRYGYLDDANQDEKKVDQHYDSLASTGLFDEKLLSNLKLMASHASWYAANTRARHFEDAKTDKTYFDHFSKIIQGEVTLLSVDFDDKAGKVAGQIPKDVGHLCLDNSDIDIAESTKLLVTYTQGQTHSWSTTLGFRVNIAEKIKAGFIFAEEETTVSFDVSLEHTWSGSSSDGTTKEYSYPLVVPAHKIYEGKATVNQANMDVPYTIQMAIGDYKWTSSGTWSGVAVSKSSYKISDITPNACAEEMLDIWVAV